MTGRRSSDGWDVPHAPFGGVSPAAPSAVPPVPSRRPSTPQGRPSRRRSGCPAVTEQAPFYDRGAPFPTTFWLTCPFLVAAISRLEADGGVEAWTKRVRRDGDLRRSLADAEREQRALRPELPVGIGGSSRP